MRYISLHGAADNLWHFKKTQRHARVTVQQASPLSRAAAYSNARATPDAGAIWEAKFIICFLRAAVSSLSISDCTVTPSIQAPDTRGWKGGDYVCGISN